MRGTVLASILSLIFIGTGCMNNDVVEPKIIVDPIGQILVSKDSITSGEHLGIGVTTKADVVYGMLQKLKHTIGLEYVNVVNDGDVDIGHLRDRIPLYQSVFLDERKGTDTGVQFSFEYGKVKSIYLNSGKKLSQWPVNEISSNAIRVDDEVEGLHNKLLKIHSRNAYVAKFERISLFTKVMSTPYDPEMSNSRQWYFRYVVEPGLYEIVKINLVGGKVEYFEVIRFKDPS